MSYIPPKEWERLLKRVFAIDADGHLQVDIVDPSGLATKDVPVRTLTIKDIDPTPVGDVLLKVLDQVLKVRDSADTVDVELSALRAVLSGDPPLSVVGTSVVTNLNADLLDGLHADEIKQITGIHFTRTPPVSWTSNVTEDVIIVYSAGFCNYANSRHYVDAIFDGVIRATTFGPHTHGLDYRDYGCGTAISVQTGVAPGSHSADGQVRKVDFGAVTIRTEHLLVIRKKA